MNPVGNVHLPYRLPTSVADLPQFSQSSPLRNQGGIGHVRHIPALPAGPLFCVWLGCACQDCGGRTYRHKFLRFVYGIGKRGGFLKRT